MNLAEIFNEIKSYTGNDHITHRFLVQNNRDVLKSFWIIDKQINIKWLYYFSYDDFVSKDWTLYIEVKKEDIDIPLGAGQWKFLEEE